MKDDHHHDGHPAEGINLDVPPGRTAGGESVVVQVCDPPQTGQNRAWEGMREPQWRQYRSVAGGRIPPPAARDGEIRRGERDGFSTSIRIDPSGAGRTAGSDVPCGTGAGGGDVILTRDGACRGAGFSTGSVLSGAATGVSLRSSGTGAGAGSTRGAGGTGGCGGAFTRTSGASMIGATRS